MLLIRVSYRDTYQLFVSSLRRVLRTYPPLTVSTVRNYIFLSYFKSFRRSGKEEGMRKQMEKKRKLQTEKERLYLNKGQRVKDRI